jgi:hypothetical protein
MRLFHRVGERSTQLLAALTLSIVAPALPLVATADPITVSAGVVGDLDAVRHSINGSLETFTAPLPFLSLEARTSRLGVTAEGLSTFGPLAFDGQHTKLDVDIAALRAYAPQGEFAGVGLTALNQTTAFDPMTYPGAILDNLTERSHLNGVRYELGFETPRFSIVAAASPALHGYVFDHCLEATPVVAGLPCFEQNYATVDLAVPEVSAEFDATLRYLIPLSKHVDLVTGFRYITFVGKTMYPTGTSNDQNTGTPLISVGVRVHSR